MLYLYLFYGYIGVVHINKEVLHELKWFNY